MRLTIIGTGYVGLVTGTCFAESGNHVICYDIDYTKIEKMKRGHVPIYEPGLEELFHRNTEEGRLEFSSNLDESIKDSGVIFLALPTPPNNDGSADLSYITSVAKQIGPLLNKYTMVINKSTVPVGTADKVRKILKNNCNVAFDVVSNPEFLREGFAVGDFMRPDRIIIGTKSAKAKKILGELYTPFVRQGNPIYFMDEYSSEMTKYAANSFLATKISFINEVANICEEVGANVDSVRLGMGADERIGKRFLFPGIGYGGSCFPKDIKALESIALCYGYEFEILKSVSKVNEKQKHILFTKINRFYNGNLKNKKFALWGLSFKPNTDDIREAPALHVIDQLINEGAKIIAYDPAAAENVRKIYNDNKNLNIVDDELLATENADALIIATEWSVFRSPDFSELKKKLKKPIIFDGRNLYDIEEMKELGFYYESIGRKTIRNE